MGFGTIFQLAGALLGLIFGLLGHPYLATAFFILHVTGDGIVGFLLPLAGLKSFEQGEAAKFVKLRPFLLFVGIALMNVGFWDKGISVTLGSFHILTSFGLFQFGFFLALIGGFTYDLIYT